MRVGEAQNPGPVRRVRRVPSEGSEFGPSTLVGAAIHHDLTLIDSSDDDALLVGTNFPALVDARVPEIESGVGDGVQHMCPVLNPSVNPRLKVLI